MPNCRICGADAGPEKWRTLCRSCFKEMKRREEEATVREIDNLRAEIGRLNVLTAKQTTIPAARLRQLIQLCHPDKHNGSATSNEVTQWLLEMRKTK